MLSVSRCHRVLMTISTEKVLYSVPFITYFVLWSWGFAAEQVHASCAERHSFTSLANSLNVCVLWWHPSARQICHQVIEFVPGRSGMELRPLSALKLRGSPRVGFGVSWDVWQSGWAEGFLQVVGPTNLLPRSPTAHFGLMTSSVGRSYGHSPDRIGESTSDWDQVIT